MGLLELNILRRSDQKFACVSSGSKMLDPSLVDATKRIKKACKYAGVPAEFREFTAAGRRLNILRRSDQSFACVSSGSKILDPFLWLQHFPSLSSFRTCRSKVEFFLSSEADLLHILGAFFEGSSAQRLRCHFVVF